MKTRKNITSSADHVSTETLVFYLREAEDYQNNPVKTGWLAYTNVRDLLAQFFLTTHYGFSKIHNWRKYCIGITSLQQGESKTEASLTHLPMFDYDGKHIKTLIRKDVKLLQESFKLGPAHVFRTKRGFHVIFMCDEVKWEEYSDMLSVVKCCQGFKKITQRNAYATLRVSAKYTDFDIKPEYVLEPEKRTKVWRKQRKAYLIEAFHDLGERCGTHFACLFPEWAPFKEDKKIWKRKIHRLPHKNKLLIKTLHPSSTASLYKFTPRCTYIS